ncbi:hypothetical protein [Paraliomyxa miuraensis]|uniref:hypothetical protein n=1 Tax=Paraliomyxa miuraensis TaxID=376150 RepID=UPI002252D60B|nr:hypothetical protein [Paraliomyxa miuraensis]MCX4245081.1 hypothetical protein [Paraliomyxa miuraensis]
METTSHIHRCARVLVLSTLALGCGDDQGQTPEGSSGTTTGASAEGTATASTDPTGSSTTAVNDDSTSTSSGDPTGPADTTAADTTETTGTPSDCDYEVIDGRIVIEAEELPITEDWQIQTTEPDYYADGYIGWTRGSFNNDPTHGVIEVTIHVAEPGRYQLRWRNRIGMGANTTEHNDTWVRFPDATDFYGRQAAGANERRRYPRPLCEDADAMAAIEALPNVDEAACVQGSSVDGWLKVYSSGASDWSWSTRTNDNDAYDVMVEFGSPGDYVFALAARGDWHLIDRIVIHQEGLDDAIVQDPSAVPTTCR